MLESLLNNFKFLPPGIELIIVVLSTIAIGSFISYLLVKSLHKVFYQYKIFHHLKLTIYFLIPVFCLSITLPFTTLGQENVEITELVFKMLYIIAMTLLLFEVTVWLFDKLKMKYTNSNMDINKKGKFLTQLKYGRRIAVSLVILLGVCSALMNFEGVRNLGVSILTSAAVASVILGFAAQNTLSNLFSGFQIAFSEPIKIGDTLVVQGELGEVEDITLTYVSLLLWDKRRLVLPINYLLKEPYQNWTHVSAELIGTVFLYVDYAMPIQPLRDELKRILNESQLWNKKVSALQVTDMKEKSMEIRILVSGDTGGNTWDLRCEVREKMIEFIQRNYANYLPKNRNDNTSITPESY